MDVTDLHASGARDDREREFRIVVRARADCTLVAPYGELDLASAPRLEAALASRAGPVVLDLRGITFIDASGLRALLDAEARSRQDGMALRFVAGAAVRRLFEVCGAADPLTYGEPPAA